MGRVAAFESPEVLTPPIQLPVSRSHARRRDFPTVIPSLRTHHNHAHQLSFPQSREPKPSETELIGWLLQIIPNTRNSLIKPTDIRRNTEVEVFDESRILSKLAETSGDTPQCSKVSSSLAQALEDWSSQN